jgi:hypothetical protein
MHDLKLFIIIIKVNYKVKSQQKSVSESCWSEQKENGLKIKNKNKKTEGKRRTYKERGKQSTKER